MAPRRQSRDVSGKLGGVERQEIGAGQARQNHSAKSAEIGEMGEKPHELLAHGVAQLSARRAAGMVGLKFDPVHANERVFCQAEMIAAHG